MAPIALHSCNCITVSCAASHPERMNLKKCASAHSLAQYLRSNVNALKEPLQNHLQHIAYNLNQREFWAVLHRPSGLFQQ